MADNASEQIKTLSVDVQNLDKRLQSAISHVAEYDKEIALWFEKARVQGMANTEQLVDYLSKRFSNLQIKTVVSPFEEALGLKEAKKEVEKVPTMFERVIAQINQKSQNSGQNISKKLFNADVMVMEAKDAFAKVTKELNASISTVRESGSPLLERLLSIDQSILSKNDVRKLNERIAKIKQDLSNVGKLQGSVESGGQNQQLVEALRRYQEALQKVFQLQEQFNQSQQKFASNISAVEGVTRRYNDNEQALAKLQQRWEELNVKKQAGLVNQKDFDAQTQKILDEYDRLIAKRKEFEIGDLGQMSYQRKSEREQEEERLAQLRKSNTQARLDDEMRAERMIKQARAERAKKEAEADANMKKAVSQQVTSYKQLSALLKQYNSLKQVKGRTQKEEAALERTRQKIKEIIASMRELDSKQKGSLDKARDITAYDRILAKDKEITRERQKQNDLTKQQKANLDRLLPTLQRLASAFGIAFSVRGLAQFGKKLIETRGEFEMQFVAMKQIIGDVDAATKIWNQTLQQALQSPKTFKELVTYTKQLAAYRVETEKLFDTTKRLADVSAGLGVDMGRLILAYGQVKAANYLRASEVRQFTEAGVNIYGELAKYFSEIEGRAVGTAEVVERVTKRMVLFSDVENIFKRMTDEGGAFFNMQEIQADTVKGQIMKLRDAYDQMLNTIGERNQGTIRDLVDAINELVRNWRDVASFIMKNVNALAILLPLITAYRKGAKLAGAATYTWKEALTLTIPNIKNMTKSLSLSQIAIKSFIGVVELAKTALRTFLPLLVFEGITWFITKLGHARREIKAFREELEKVSTENIDSMSREIDGYGVLLEKIKETNEGTLARKELMDEMSSKYGKYLDFVVNEKTSVDDLSNAYDRVTQSIRNYTAEKIRGEQEQKLGTAMYDEYQNMIKALTGATITDMEGLHNYGTLTKQQAQNIAKLIRESLEKYGSADINQIIQTYLGDTYGKGKNIRGGVGKDLQAFVNNWTSLNEELKSITSEFAMPVFGTETEYREYQSRVNELRNFLQLGDAEYKKQSAAIKERTDLEQWQAKEKIDALEKEYKLRKLNKQQELGLITEEQYRHGLKKMYGDLIDYEADYNKRLAVAFGERFGADWKEQNEDALKMYRAVESTESALQQGTIQRNKQLKESYDGLKDSLKQYEARLLAAKSTGASESVIEGIEGDIKWAKQNMEAIELAAKLRGIDLSDKKSGGTDTIYSDRIRLLQRMFEAYKKAAKEAYSFAVAEGKVKDSFENEWANLMPAGYGAEKVPTSYDALKTMLERLKAFTPQFDKDGKLTKAFKDLMSAVSDATYQIDFEVSVEKREDLKKQIESMFENYELTLDLEKLSLPAGELANIFGYQITTLDMIEEKIKDGVKLLEDAGYKPEEAVKIVEGLQNKLDDITRKALVNRLKTYTAYLEKGRDEAVKIHLDELKKMAELDALYKEGYYTDTQYKDIQSKIRKETDQALAKNKWEDFKKSDFYVTMFEDMGNVADVSIDIMIKKLKDLKDNVKELDPTQVKEIVKAIDKLEKTKRSRSLFGTFMDDRRLKKEWINTPDTTDDWLSTLTHDEQVWQARHDVIANKVAELTQEYNEAIKSGDTERAKELQQQIDVTTSGLNHVNDVLEETRKNIADITNEQNEGYAAWVRYHMGVAKGAQDFSNAAQAAGTIATDMMEMFDKADNASKKLAHDLVDIAVNAGLLVADIAKAISSKGTDIGAMVDGLIRTWNIIKSGLSASEKDLNRTIDQNKLKLEELEITLGRVEKAREKAWDTQSAVQASNEMRRVIEQQKKAYQALINAENAKKSTDEDLVRQYERAIDELDEALEDEKNKMLELFGGLGENAYRGEAQNFVDAWKEAFLETGDGLQGLQDHFDEFLNEWFVKQATMRVAGKMLAPLFEDIDKAVDQYNAGGTNVLMSELNAIREKFGIIAPQLSDALEQLAGMWGLGDTEGGLSGLAAGIQGMSEEQANILEAYWNSVRMYTASIDMNVSRIADMLGAGSRDITNPQLQQLELIAHNTASIQRMFESVVMSGHPKGQSGIRVFMD